MSKVNIKTITPVHIGSGEFLQYNSDFIDVTNLRTEQRWIQIIDDQKILELIGEENVQHWVLAIERNEDIKEFVRRMAPESKIKDYSKRRLDLNTGINDTDTLKEQIHNGLGLPYIPGSSIKGAIRTAVIASLMDSEENRQKAAESISNNRFNFESALVGNDPQNDIFRFLQVGDAYFEKGTETALRLVMGLNITSSNQVNVTRNNKPQLIEAVKAGTGTEINIKLDSNAYNFARSNCSTIGQMPNSMSNLPSLFSTINKHTLKLINEEIDYWQNVSYELSGAEDYLENLHSIQSDVKSCQKNECILRIGHASGWRFITGAWSEHFIDDNIAIWNKIVNESRFRNEQYRGYDFPKSRRLDEDSDLLGFVKLTLLE